MRQDVSYRYSTSYLISIYNLFESYALFEKLFENLFDKLVPPVRQLRRRGARTYRLGGL